MAVAALMMFMAASVSAVTLTMTGDGRCLSLDGDEPTVGVLVNVDTCNPDDPRQANWAVNVVGTEGDSVTYTFCINGTNLCDGYEKDGDIYLKNQRLQIADPSSLAQQWTWINTPELPNNYINLGINLCDEVVDDLIEGRECENIPAQQWISVDM